MTDKNQTTFDLDSLREEIARKRESCASFSRKRKQRLESVQRDLTGNLEALIEQHSDWEDFRRKTEKASIGLKKERSGIERDRADLEAQLLELQEKSLETEEQRTRIAKKFKEKREAIREDSKEVSSLQAQIKDLKNQIETQASEDGDWEIERGELLAKIEDSKSREQEIKQKAAEGVRVANERGKQIVALRQQIKELGESSGDSQALENLTRERDDLVKNREELASRVKELEKQIEEGGGTGEGGDEALEQLRKENEALRLELQSSRNSFDEEELEELSDWEKRKRELMRQLEDDNSDQEEKSKLESAIAKTNKVVAAKDHKINELQSKLEQLVDMVEKQQAAGGNEGSSSEGGEGGDIEEEQKRLQTLQEQWKEKLREAEVEIAVQRAEFARQQSELEEKTRDVEAQLALAKKQVALSSDGDNAKKKKGWLGR